MYKVVHLFCPKSAEQSLLCFTREHTVNSKIINLLNTLQLCWTFQGIQWFTTLLNMVLHVRKKAVK